MDETEIKIHNLVDPLVKFLLLWPVGMFWGWAFLRPGREWIYFLGGIFIFIKSLNLLFLTIKGFIGLFQKVHGERTGMSQEEVKEANILWKNKEYRGLVRRWKKEVSINKKLGM